MLKIGSFGVFYHDIMVKHLFSCYRRFWLIIIRKQDDIIQICLTFIYNYNIVYHYNLHLIYILIIYSRFLIIFTIIIADCLFMIFSAAVNHKRPINLLCQHNSEERMRKSHIGNRNKLVGTLLDLIRKPA